ncbi:MAG: pantoate--beta-alanine ligase [Deltaproteobacteria bacterium]|nr:MAG: pantoate--beta-alanine ligase [Deltaproteobacteria bacterium]
MEVIRSPRQMQERAEALRMEGKRIGFVPTMGYLHEAHLSLVRKAKRLSDVVVVSIFVNPTQFGPGEDFERYPRDEEGDRAKLEAEGVDILFSPSPEDMYPAGYQTFVEVTEVSKGLCGDFRPGHFRGVATVVAKLFNIVRPHLAVFGEKDYQQLLVIKRMVEDLNFPVEIVPGELVREEDGIAMSSRNVYLSPEEREKALVLSRALFRGRELYEKGEKDARVIRDAVREMIEAEEGVALQYAEVRDAETLEVIERIDRPAVIAVAAVVGPARLIDNVVIGREDK